jgi:hypothetical protein
MIAGSDDLDAQVEKFLGDLWSNAKAAGGVLAIGDRQVDIVLSDQLPQVIANDGPAGSAKDVADKENAHAPRLPNFF